MIAFRNVKLRRVYIQVSLSCRDIQYPYWRASHCGRNRRRTDSRHRCHMISHSERVSCRQTTAEYLHGQYFRLCNPVSFISGADYSARTRLGDSLYRYDVEPQSQLIVIMARPCGMVGVRGGGGGGAGFSARVCRLARRAGGGASVRTYVRPSVTAPTTTHHVTVESGRAHSTL